MARLAVVIGDPTGIGPEVLARALVASPRGAPAELLVIGDAQTWEEAQRGAGVRLPPVPAERPRAAGSEGVPFLDLPPEERDWRTGEMSPAAGRAAARWLEHAVRLALAGDADAVVFAPLNKQAIMRAGYAARDEYDLCAALAGVAEHDEMNVIPARSTCCEASRSTALADTAAHPAGRDLLWVARVTSHVPLREVTGLLTVERVLRTIRLAHGVASAAAGAPGAGGHARRGAAGPRVGVAALNPHAGEGGLAGDEETRIIRPAIEAAAAEGINASGPHPADHIFRRARAGDLDAVVSMYHDQAQIATKLLGFERGVSVGVGYPFVLVTPSHGTAFDIAGRGIADPGPMGQALLIAERLASVRAKW
ncbi:MAG: 4-hydroxythreonine-4-phosphate dehydrogenase PdxA [Armatimonadetes bacterium]|nr:4-hydroxythreonine-4-phosphate dehydrogenase PdxA [Armatimonadota bacterium]